MSRPRDTRNDPLAAIFPPLLQTVAPGGIEEQEAEGAAAMQAGDCEVIPTEVNSGTEPDLIAVGFTLGPLVQGDPLFRRATLPLGWKRVGTGHSMWTHIVDEVGRERVSMFYKAAYYDRRAFLNVQTVRGYVASLGGSQAPLILDDIWATAEAVRSAIEDLRAYAAGNAEFWTTRGEQDYIDQYRAEVARYDELAAELRPGGGA